MISKSQQNMIVLDDDTKVSQNHQHEMPKNLSLDKINCDNAPTQSSSMENEKILADQLNENSKNKILSEDVEMKSNEFQSATRLQLSFSVDRILSDKSSKISQKLTTDEVSDERLSEKCYGELNSSYACCSLPNCFVTTTSPSTTLCKGNSNLDNEEEMIISPAFNFMDFKSVVRPTPVRAMDRNAPEAALPLTHFSSLPPTSLIRYHHAHLQQQKQLPSQPLPAQQQSFSMSSLMNPLCGLKTLHLSPQQMGLQNFATAPVNRFNAKVNFEVPIARPNLACISTLRHHHVGTANSSDMHSQLNFSNSTTTAAPVNTSTHTNASTGNSSGNVGGGVKRKRSWSRAVFSNLQRKGLEIQFQQQKYITKPDRRKLAARLNLTDAQVKVWFQNRRMKWRHTRENLKSGQEKQPVDATAADTLKVKVEGVAGIDLPGYSSDGSSSLEMSDVEDDDDEIDVVE